MTEEDKRYRQGRSFKQREGQYKFMEFLIGLCAVCFFAFLFYEILKKQLLLKSIITEQDWQTWGTKVGIDYLRDNHFAELKEAELLREKIQTLDQISNYVGEYFSKEWVQKNVLLFDEEEITNMNKDLEAAQAQEPENDQGAV